jgi:hypothetical protein
MFNTPDAARVAWFDAPLAGLATYVIGPPATVITGSGTPASCVIGPVIEFLIAEAHRNNLRVVAHTHALSDFKHLLRSEVDAFAHPTWRQTEVEPVDDELVALFKKHPNVPVMTSVWTPRRTRRR